MDARPPIPPTDDTPADESDAQHTRASVIFMEMMRREMARHNAPDSDAEAAPDAPPIAPPIAPEPPPFVGQRPAAAVTPSTRPPAPPMSEAERRRAAALEQQRLQRVQRRQQKRRRRAVSTLGGFIRALMIILVSAGLMATILSWWTDASFLPTEIRRELPAALALADNPTAVPTAMPTPNYLKRIGIVSGHRGPGQYAAYDPGAVCDDGLTENSINYRVSQLVVDGLRARGYTVELLDEFDPRLNDYRAEALVSVHANDCRDYGELVTGFLVAKAAAKPEGGVDTELAECIALHYGQVTGLDRRFGLTEDMTDYHNFREINPLTPAAIIEIGFMRADRALIETQPDVVARGIIDGVLCFLEPADEAVVGEPTPAAPAATAAPSSDDSAAVPTEPVPGG